MTTLCDAAVNRELIWNTKATKPASEPQLRGEGHGVPVIFYSVSMFGCRPAANTCRCTGTGQCVLGPDLHFSGWVLSKYQLTLNTDLS